MVSPRGLLVQLAGLGDLVMALPAIDALIEHYPDMEWTILTRPAQASLLADYNIRVITMAWPPKPCLFLKQFSTLWELRKMRFDLAFHLYSLGSRKGEWGIRMLFGVIRASYSVGRVRKGKGPFDVNWDESKIASKHEVDLNLALLSAVGITPTQTTPIVNVSKKVQVDVDQRLALQFPDDIPLAAIFTGGARSTRHWPIDRYAALAHYFRDLGMGVCIVGGKEESEDAKHIAHNFPLVVSFADELGLLELGALLKRSKIYVGNDSGPSHLAAAVGVPSVVLFGAGDVRRYAPRGKKPVHISRVEVDCSPCYLEICSHHTCMRSLSVDMVKRQIDAALH